MLAENGGRMSLREFVAQALYDPESGYYTTNIRTVGRRGDFSTSASVEGLKRPFAQAIGRWIQGNRFPHVIEVGAGDGSLAVAVMKSLGWWARKRLHYHIVDASPKLIALQKKTLGEAGVRATWHATMADAVSAAGGRASVFSNELVDAFPPDVFQWDAGSDAWLEVGLELSAEGAIHEACRPTSLSPDLGLSFPDGQRVEVHFSYRDWLTQWIKNSEKIAMITVDYGDTTPRIYHRRPKGTLRAYFHHQLLIGDDVYARPGQQDITADVNFSQLESWGNSLGMTSSAPMTQGEFCRTNSAGNDESELFHVIMQQF